MKTGAIWRSFETHFLCKKKQSESVHASNFNQDVVLLVDMFYQNVSILSYTPLTETTFFGKWPSRPAWKTQFCSEINCWNVWVQRSTSVQLCRQMYILQSLLILHLTGSHSLKTQRYKEKTIKANNSVRKLSRKRFLVPLPPSPTFSANNEDLI